MQSRFGSVRATCPEALECRCQHSNVASSNQSIPRYGVKGGSGEAGPQLYFGSTLVRHKLKGMGE